MMILIMVRNILPVLIVIVLGGQACSAERDTRREIPLGYGPQKPPLTQPNPCLAHGPGFQAVPGTNSCVKVIGGVRMDTTSTRKLR